MELLRPDDGRRPGASGLGCLPEAHALGQTGQDALVLVLVDGLVGVVFQTRGCRPK